MGTFFLVFGGVGTAVIDGGQVGNLGIAFAFGLSLLAMAYAVGPISGCHINPAVTLGLFLRGRIEIVEAAWYWVAQVLGAIVAAALILVIAKARHGGYDAGQLGLGSNGYGTHSPGGFNAGAAVIVELLMTALLIFTVLAATDRLAETAFAGIPIGLVLVLIHLVSLPVTNTSVNPARSIGPALFAGGWAIRELWLFILVPLGGAVLGAGLHALLFQRDSSQIPPESSAVGAEGRSAE